MEIYHMGALKLHPTTKYTKELVAVLSDLWDKGAIKPLHAVQTSVPNYHHCDQILLTPNIHKPACPDQPKVISRGSITYNMAKFVADSIAPLVGCSPHHIKNSSDHVTTLS